MSVSAGRHGAPLEQRAARLLVNVRRRRMASKRIFGAEKAAIATVLQKRYARRQGGAPD